MIIVYTLYGRDGPAYKEYIMIYELTNKIMQDVKRDVIGVILARGPVCIDIIHHECMIQTSNYEQLTDWCKGIAIENAIKSGINDGIISVNVHIDTDDNEHTVSFDVK